MLYEPLNPYVDVFFYRVNDNCWDYDQRYKTDCPYIRFQNGRSCFDLARKSYDQIIAFDTGGHARKLVYEGVYHTDGYSKIIATNCRNISQISYNPGNNIAINDTILVMAFMLVIPAAYVTIKMTAKIVRIFR
jgi:hypothetical protein